MKNPIKKTVAKKELIDQLLDQKFDNLKAMKGGATTVDGPGPGNCVTPT